jgi:hypothetical protein
VVDLVCVVLEVEEDFEVEVGALELDVDDPIGSASGPGTYFNLS